MENYGKIGYDGENDNDISVEKVGWSGLVSDSAPDMEAMMTFETP